ncbi:MAG: PqqD family protein [Prevotellaceae bacterium]|nr:PqqD family protein [Prevotellaceae bacterium]MCD8285555.1 PqqD family protein [Prevotellaceae bacterium]MCD8303431.1 PqqD family protein [Prevotellaceae bacterium]
MRIKEGFELRRVCGENIIIATGRRNIDFSKVVTLNESAALLFEAAQGRDFTERDLLPVLTAEYDVGEEQALGDIREMLHEWAETGLTEE